MLRVSLHSTPRRICTQCSTSTTAYIIRPRAVLYTQYSAYSTTGPQTQNEKTEGSSGHPPIASTSSSRRSVDLHPAPRKPSATSSHASPAKTTASSSTNTQSTSSSMGAQEAASLQVEKVKGRPMPRLYLPPMPTPEPSSGIFKTTVADIDDALQSGVLQPIPPNTAGWALTWHKFKELVKFYFFGVKKLGSEHRLMAIAIRQKDKTKRTWRENEFVRTYRADLLRLIPFISIIAILEEALPLVVIYAPFLLPSTCKLPGQQRRIDSIADQKRAKALLLAHDALSKANVEITSILPGNTAEPTIVRAVSRILGLPAYLPTFFQRQLITRRLRTLASQDAQIIQDVDNGLSVSTDYTVDELKTILGRQGFPTTGLAPTQLRENLQNYLVVPKNVDVSPETWSLMRIGAIVAATNVWRQPAIKS